MKIRKTTPQFQHLFVALIVIFFSGCIPSLHPLATEDNRVTDSRIEGIWLSESSKSPIVSYEYQVESDDPNDKADGIAAMEELLSEFEGNQEVWLFERVGEFHFSNNDGKTKASIDPAVPSLMTWEIDSVDYYDYYLLTFHRISRGDTATERMWVHLTTINDMLLADFSPSHLKNPVYNEDARFAANYVAGHTFAKLEFKEGKLLMFPLNSSYLEDLLDQNKIRLKHEDVDGSIILTASTEELRSFIAKYDDDPNLFEDAEMLLEG